MRETLSSRCVSPTGVPVWSQLQQGPIPMANPYGEGLGTEGRVQQRLAPSAIGERVPCLDLSLSGFSPYVRSYRRTQLCQDC